MRLETTEQGTPFFTGWTPIDRDEMEIMKVEMELITMAMCLVDEEDESDEINIDGDIDFG